MTIFPVVQGLQFLLQLISYPLLYASRSQCLRASVVKDLPYEMIKINLISTNNREIVRGLIGYTGGGGVGRREYGNLHPYNSNNTNTINKFSNVLMNTKIIIS